jgi:REP element-mobilizing transposase RayT
MPNHVHALIKPVGEYELADILRDMKGYVARRTNEELGRSGVLWEQESYDRIIRDEEHLYRVVQYIGRNPGMAGLPESAWYRWIDPRWVRAGWRFEM